MNIVVSPRMAHRPAFAARLRWTGRRQLEFWTIVDWQAGRVALAEMVRIGRIGHIGRIFLAMVLHIVRRRSANNWGASQPQAHKSEKKPEIRFVVAAPLAISLGMPVSGLILWATNPEWRSVQHHLPKLAYSGLHIFHSDPPSLPPPPKAMVGRQSYGRTGGVFSLCIRRGFSFSDDCLRDCAA